jgi:hypothetical protein
METVLGLFGIAFWIAGTISLAVGVTYLAVRLFPGDDDAAPQPQSTPVSGHRLKRQRLLERHER